ncbi:NCA2-domain-containing protein [Myriangium duriaei CBS 260.36]|uniref:NCA2-domain-containing protein n=1 Tax=Myriangium duriaei CBS 260.36 TaxID=1168546 RepID=A0A9P4J1E3_9PEZI|nr:NCA2-domain-containing protein [Myriangium duriaei CBS 260.36]
MSLVLGQVQRIDAQLDRIQLQSSAQQQQKLQPGGEFSLSSQEQHPTHLSPRAAALHAAIKALSIDASSSHPLLSARNIQYHLDAARFGEPQGVQTAEAQAGAEYERELEWLLVSKATTQVYGVVIERLLQQTVSIAEDVYYWDAVLGKWRYTMIYSAQTGPGRVWEWGSAVWEDVKERAAGFDISNAGREVGQSFTEQWGGFYRLVRQVVRERGVKEMRRTVVSPVARIRSEIRQKQVKLKQARLRGANALGVLLGEGLMNESVHGDGLATPNEDDGGRRWKVSVTRNVALMDAVLAKVNLPGLDVDKFDAAIAEETDEDAFYEVDVRFQTDGEGGGPSISPSAVAARLSKLVSSSLQTYDDSSKAITRTHGKPSRLVRYWLPVTIGVLSSSTVLRILVNRKAEIVTWIEELGATMIDFWSNWVVEPTRKVIKTIRHDEGSEVSIMSKRSLEGDRDSLERMVVEFARDNPANATTTGQALTDVELADIRAKVREGDLTPVLKAYEQDLTSPFMGAIRGNLIRALLIQVQKTKVDVEVAMGGIDALLKSQELVFGFVGLTPGILVTVALWRWLRGSFSDRKGTDRQRKHGIMVRQLRNIDRVLSNSTPTDFGELFYKDHGLLLCEVHVLRQEAKKSMPEQVYNEFLDEVDELVDVRSGVKRQKSVVERIRWAYARWF